MVGVGELAKSPSCTREVGALSLTVVANLALDAVTDKEICVPLSKGTMVYALEVAPAIAEPSRFHWKVNEVGVGFHPTFEAVRVTPTFATPEITGAGLSLKGDVTAAVGALALIWEVNASRFPVTSTVICLPRSAATSS